MNPRVPRLFPALGPWTAAALTHGFVAPTRELDAEELAGELDHLLAEKLGPFLLRLLDESDHAVDPALVARVRADVASRVARSHRTARVAARTVTRLGAAGITAVVIKGEGLARHYGRPLSRTWTDADVVVDPTDFPAAFALLAADGWAELDVSRQPREDFNLRCREGVNLTLGPRTSVDLHHRVSPWWWSRGLTVDRMLATVAPDAAVSGADNLAITALQLIGDHRAPGGKLISWRDVAELGHTLDPVATADRLAVTGCAGVVGTVLRQLPQALQPAELVRLLPAAPEHSRRLHWMVASARAGHTALSHVLRLPWRNAAHFVVGTVRPSPGFLAEAVPGARRPQLAWLGRLVRGATDLGDGTVGEAGTGSAPADGTDEFTLRGDDALRWVVVDDGRVEVSDTTAGRAYTLDHGAAPLWHALADGVSRADLAAVIRAVDDVDPPTASLRALGFLVDMESRGLTRRG